MNGETAIGTNGSNPFVGLRPFRSEETLLFFGRRQQATELMERLHRSRFLAVVGSSGCGKSSLIRAGLIPRLKAGFLVENRDQWVEIAMTPGEHPLARLAGGFGIGETELRESGAAGAVAQFLRQAGAPDRNCLLLIDQFEELFRFTLSGSGQEDAADFVAVLLALAEQREFPVFVVLTMRSDFLGDCDTFQGLPEALNRGIYLVPRHTRAQRREAIEGPARLFGGKMTGQLIDRVLNDVGDEPDQLPVMEHALMRTWENWQQAGSGGDVDLPNYLTIGAAKEALSRDAESAMEGMTAEERALTAQIFQALTDTDAGNRRIRRSVRMRDLMSISSRSRAEIERIIDRFREGGRSFLVVQAEPDSDDALIDISHESLIRQWPTLRSWVDEEAESKRIYLDLIGAVERKKALLHDSDLQVALEWRKRRAPTAAWARRYHPRFADAMAFLDASRDEARRWVEERERQRSAELRERRSRRIAGAFLFLALLAAGAAAWAFRAQRESSRLRAAAENAAKQANDNASDAQTQAQLALSAEKQARAEKQNATRAGEAANRERARAEAERQNAIAQEKIAQGEAARANLAKADADSLRQQAEKTAAQKSELAAAADQSRAAALSAKQEEEGQRRLVAKSLALSVVQDAGRLVDLGKKEQALAYLARALQLDDSSQAAKSWIFDLLLRGGFRTAAAPFTHPALAGTDRILSAEFSPDGRFVVTASWNNAAQIWDTGSGKPAGRAMIHKGIVNFASFSPDGRLIVTASADNTARLWRAASAEVFGQPLLHKAPVTSAAFSPDGRRIVTASWDKTARVWSVEDRQPVGAPLQHNGPVTSAAFSPDGQLVVTASWDNTAQVWEASSGKQVAAPLRHGGQVRFARFSPDGSRVVTGSADSTARVWDWRTGQPIGDPIRHSRAVNSAEISPDGLRIVTASDDNTARLWEVGTGTPIGAPLRRQGRVSSATFSPDGKRVVTASYDGTAQIWDVWIDFDDSKLLADFVEALGGYQVAKLPDLVKLADQQKRIDELRGIVQMSKENGTTVKFLRWFFSGFK